MLPSVIKAAEQKGCQINFRQLFWDLVRWDNDRKVEWASEFWGSKEQEAE
jgi:hypothetical protein